MYLRSIWKLTVELGTSTGCFIVILVKNNNEDIDKMKSINYWGKTYDEWLEGLISMTNDRDSFLKQIETNINSEKLRKLPRYNLIP